MVITNNRLVIPVSLSNMDGDDWTVLRRELRHAPGIISSDSRMAMMVHDRWSRYSNLYSRFFNPLFPVVTLPKETDLLASRPSPLLAGVMTAIGAQQDMDSSSKSFAMDLLEASSRIYSKVRCPFLFVSSLSNRMLA